MGHSEHGTTGDERSEEQPTDKSQDRATPRRHPDKSTMREATRDPKLNDAEKTPGSGMTPDDGGDAPTG